MRVDNITEKNIKLNVILIDIHSHEIIQLVSDSHGDIVR